MVIFGLDDAGRLGSGPVVAALPAGGALSVDARGLERGAAGLSGRLGGGSGDWRLMVFASAPIEAMALLDNPAGPLANLSGAAARAGDIPWFAPADDLLRQGSLRIASRTGDGEVLIHAVDDAGRDRGPVTLTVDGAGTVRLDSGDLERGNPARGLPAGLGDGDGGWRLRLESALSLDAASYLRTPDGFLTAVNEAAGEANRRHYVPLFHAAGGTGPRSLLRLINPSAGAARVAILGWDDDGEIAPEGGVALTLPAGASRILDAGALEEGAEGLSGRFGQGRGSWRLALKSDRDVRAMNLAESAAGHLADLGTSAALDRFPDACFDGPDSDGDGVADGCLGGAQPAPLELVAGGCSDGRYVADPADNAGLAGDCRALVALAQALARNGELSEDHPMREWGDRRHTGDGQNGRASPLRTGASRASTSRAAGGVPAGWPAPYRRTCSG